MLDNAGKSMYDFLTYILLESGTISREQAEELSRTRDHPLDEENA